MPDTDTNGGRKKFSCLSCVRKGRETEAGPSSVKDKDDKFTICQRCASEISMNEINKCRTTTEAVLRKAEGSAKEFVKRVLRLFDRTGDIGEIWSGTKTGGRGSYKNAEYRARDVRALAQLAVARPVHVVALKVAEKAVDALKASQKPQSDQYAEAIEAQVVYVEGRMRSAGDLIGAGFDGEINIIRPKMLDIGPRRRFWSAARDAYSTVNGLPSAIDGLVSGELGITDFQKHMEEPKSEAGASGTGDQKPTPETGEETSAGTESSAPDGQGEATVAVSETETADSEATPAKTIADLPDEVRFIKFWKTKSAQDKEQARARTMLQEHGGVIWATESLEAQIVAAAKANGSSIRVTQGKKKRRNQPHN